MDIYFSNQFDKVLYQIYSIEDAAITAVAMGNSEGGVIGFNKKSLPITYNSGEILTGIEGWQQQFYKNINRYITPDILLEPFFIDQDGEEFIVFYIDRLPDKSYLFLEQNRYGNRQVRYARIGNKNMVVTESFLNSEAIISKYRLGITFNLYDDQSTLIKRRVKYIDHKNPSSKIIHFIKKYLPFIDKIETKIVDELIYNMILHNRYDSLEPPIVELFIHNNKIILSNSFKLSSFKILKFGGYSITNRDLHSFYKDLQLVEMKGGGLKRVKTYFKENKELFKFKLEEKQGRFLIEIEEIIKDKNIVQTENSEFNIFNRQDSLTTDKPGEPLLNLTDKLNLDISDKYSKDDTSSFIYNETHISMLTFLHNNPSKTKEIMEHIGMRDRETYYNNYLYPCMENDYIAQTIPDKPRSPKQQYYTTPKGIEFLNSLNKDI